MTHPQQRRHFLQTAVALSASSWLPGLHAQSLPSTLRIVVPLPAGGGVDVAVRILAEQMAKITGSNVVVENKVGAAGLIAAQYVNAGPSDGSVLFYGHAGLLTVQAMSGRLNLLKDFKPITKVSASAHVLAVPASSPFKTQAELIAAIQAKPGKYNLGSGGNGSPTHLMAERLSDLVPGGLKFTHIPFKGSIDAMVAMLTGDIDFSFVLPGVLVEHLKTGKLRALSTTGATRLAALPQTPTVAEAGVPGFRDEPWGAILVSSKVPDATVARLFDAVKAGAQSPEFSGYVLKTGGTLESSKSPEALTQELRLALESEKVLVQRLGLKSE